MNHVQKQNFEKPQTKLLTSNAMAWRNPLLFSCFFTPALLTAEITTTAGPRPVIFSSDPGRGWSFSRSNLVVKLVARWCCFFHPPQKIGGEMIWSNLTFVYFLEMGWFNHLTVEFWFVWFQMVGVNVLTASYMMCVFVFSRSLQRNPLLVGFWDPACSISVWWLYIITLIFQFPIYLGTKLPVANILSNLTLVPNKKGNWKMRVIYILWYNSNYLIKGEPVSLYWYFSNWM